MVSANRIIAASVIGTFLSVLNTTSLLIAVPTILVDLHTNFFVVLWILILYSTTLTVLSPIFGKYSDNIGRRKLYLTGYITFFAGSMIAGFSPDTSLLAVARVVQGIAGALLFSNSLAILTDTFKSVQLQRAIGINTAVVGIGMAIGPVLGGILTEITWRAIFFFNAPIALIGYFISVVSIREVSRSGTRRVFDGRGALIFSSFLLSFTVGLTLGPFIGWANPLVILLFIITGVSMVLFLFLEKRASDPIMDPGLFRNRIFSSAVSSSLLNSISRYATIFVLILYLQGPAGFSPLISGLLMSPFAVLMGGVSYYSSRLMGRVSERNLQLIGLFLVLVASIIFAFSDRSFNYIILAVLMAVSGSGIGLFSTPNSSDIMTSVPPNVRGVAASNRTLFLNLGQVIGMTMVFTIVASFVPISTVGKVFVGTLIGQGSIQASGFVMGLSIGFLAAGISSLAAILLILGRRGRKREQL